MKMTTKPRRTSLYVKPADEEARQRLQPFVSLTRSEIYRLGLVVLLKSLRFDEFAGGPVPTLGTLTVWAITGPEADLAEFDKK